MGFLLIPTDLPGLAINFEFDTAFFCVFVAFLSLPLFWFSKDIVVLFMDNEGKYFGVNDFWLSVSPG
jgi:hypothetical protein